jgi:phospholipase/carboxylesterase/glyoxalase family protein
MTDSSDPHRDQPVLRAGADPVGARAAMIMLHGRGADAADINALSQIIGGSDITFLAPEAAGHTWYPHSFQAPVEHNEPCRTSALNVIAKLIAEVGTTGRIATDRIALLGFSQGACLALEFAARHPRRYGAVFALSGGLIGETVAAQDYSGSLAGTPVFIGCSDRDPHIPLDRVKQSAEIMKALGADVTERIYPGMGHTIVEDEILHVRRIVGTMLNGKSG